MKNNRPRIALVAVGTAASLALAGAAVAAMRGHSAHAGTAVKVTEREYHITLSSVTLSAGTVTFSIHNAGHLVHQFDLSGGGVKLARAGSIKPGTTRTLTVKLSGGTVRVWCPVPGHAALGMKASLKVNGASSGSGGTTTTKAWG
jgi:plastocyanin